ncbi:MAG: hypothetical protein M3Z21_03280 [Pseudomonadota bacterium]|nr:hypothetical protein [Pseudomonadota bacterium]
MDKTYTPAGGYPSEAQRPATADSLKTEARAKAQEVGQEVTAEARRLMEDAKSRGESLLAEQKRATADEVAGVAQALRKSAQEMHQQEHPPLITPYLERTADSIDRMASALRERDLNSLVRQVENFARRQPALFLGGAVAVGFLLARFLRSSALHSEYDYVRPHTTGPATPSSGYRPGYGYGPSTSGYGSDYGSTSSGYGSGYGSTTSGSGSGYDSTRVSAGAGYGEDTGYGRPPGGTASTTPPLERASTAADKATGSGYGSTTTSDYGRTTPSAVPSEYGARTSTTGAGTTTPGTASSPSTNIGTSTQRKGEPE